MATTDKNKSQNYYRITVDDPKITTMQTFIDKYSIYNITADELFDQNREAIFEKLMAASPAVKLAYTAAWGKFPQRAEDLDSKMNLPRFTVIAVPAKNVTKNKILLVSNVTNTQRDILRVLQSAQIAGITEDPGYVIDSAKDTSVLGSSYRKIAPNIKVIGWFRSMEFMQASLANMGVTGADYRPVRDLSKYVSHLRTTVSQNGGNFDFNLPFVPFADLVRERGVGFDKDSNPVETRGGVLGVTPEAGDTIFTSFRASAMHNYFQWLISPQDLIFMRFEKLEMETEDRGNDRIAGGVYDMIGLVDQVTVTRDGQGNDVAINVQGRDLMKLLIDDGSYFYPISTQLNASALFNNAVSGVANGRQGDTMAMMNVGKAINRLRAAAGPWGSAGFIEPFAQVMYTIEPVLKIVMQRLANISIVPDSVFNDWKERRTTMTELTPESKDEQPNEKVKNNG